MMEEVLRIKMIKIRLLVIGGFGGDIEELGIKKRIIWVVLR